MKIWVNCTNREKIERWENVLRVLRGLSRHERKKHFSMANWGVKTACGTVACAAGFCGLDPWFKRRGLKLIPYNGVDESVDIDYINYYLIGEGKIITDDKSDTKDAVTQFFGPTGTTSIFFNGEIRPVGKVINEVRRYISLMKKEVADTGAITDYDVDY